MYIFTYIYIHIHDTLYIYIYIYIYKDREKYIKIERETYRGYQDKGSTAEAAPYFQRDTGGAQGPGSAPLNRSKPPRSSPSNTLATH
jgi:hypothetical protein